MKKITLESKCSIYFCSVFFLIFILVFGPVLTNLVYATVATVNVFPSTVTASVGQNFTIDVEIADVLDLYGWEFELRWNSALLEAVDVIEGDFLNGGGERDTFNGTWIIDNTTGYILAYCTLLGDVPGVNGSGTLATVEFLVKDAGESVLDLNNTKLVSSDEQLISYGTTDGYGYFIFPHDVAVTSVTALPAMVLPGQLVNINATVQNQGVFAENFTVTVYYDATVIGTQPVSLDAGASTILTFVWDTTGVNKGDYTISAEASVVPDETDTTDNTNEADGTITVLSTGHDIAITEVTPFKTFVGQGYPLFVNATSKNYGSFPETFNVTAYYNETNFIEKQTIILSSGNYTTITLTWTTDISYGNYTISAYAEPVPNEIETSDNTFVDGWVLVTIPGDVDGDRDVDVADQRQVQLAMFTVPGDPRWNPNMDVDSDLDVDVGDQRKQQIHVFETW